MCQFTILSTIHYSIMNLLLFEGTGCLKTLYLCLVNSELLVAWHIFWTKMKKNLRLSHLKVHGTGEIVQCEECEEAFITEKELRQHRKIHIHCKPCGKTFHTKFALHRHNAFKHQVKTIKFNINEWILIIRPADNRVYFSIRSFCLLFFFNSAILYNAKCQVHILPK